MSLNQFWERMQTYLPEEDLARLKQMHSEPPYRGIRLNPLKGDITKLQEMLDFEIQATPFAADSFYVDDTLSGNHPLHLAGLFYMQEPSAGSAVEVLAPSGSDTVLDLCAAPGGKSTQIAGRLNEMGLLVANEFVSSRAQILLSNIERMGISNAIITNSATSQIAAALPDFFDKVLVDAPCSGEGMFRKEDQAQTEWSLAHAASCAVRQLPILEDGFTCLRPGGTLVYSTCTFALEENEGLIASFLSKHPDAILLDADVSFGRQGLPYPGIDHTYVRRIYPMDGGEGHFIAKIQKIDGAARSLKKVERLRPVGDPAILAFVKKQLSDIDVQRLVQHKDMILYEPKQLPSLAGIKVLRSGVLLGELSKGYLKPHHHMYRAWQGTDYCNAISLDRRDPALFAYLRGEEIAVKQSLQAGYCSVQVEGFPLGFGKVSDGRIKNHYPKGLRLR